MLTSLCDHSQELQGAPTFNTPGTDFVMAFPPEIGSVVTQEWRIGHSCRESLATTSDSQPISAGRWGNEGCGLPTGQTEGIPRKGFDGTDEMLTASTAVK